MVKRTIILFFLIFIVSCCVTNNNYGLKRTTVSKFTIKPNQNDQVYKIIDTASFYKAIYIQDSINVSNNIDHNKRDIIKINSGLLFYTNGKVGLFYDYNSPSKNIDYDPSKAIMGYYQYKDEILCLEFFKNYPTGNFLSTEIIVKYTRDTLVSFVEKTARGGGFKKIYVRHDLPKNIPNLKPDW